MNMQIQKRAQLVSRCRTLEKRALRAGADTAAQMANRFGNELLYIAVPAELYVGWINQVEGFVERRESRVAQGRAA